MCVYVCLCGCGCVCVCVHVCVVLEHKKVNVRGTECVQEKERHTCVCLMVAILFLSAS